MTTSNHVLIVSIPSEPPGTARPAPGEVHGPFRLLPQAEYVARIVGRLKGAAQIVPAGGDGPWWVRAAADA